VAREIAAAGLVDLGMTDYAAAHRLQLALVERRRSNPEAGDLFLLTEHPSTFTLGRRGGREHLRVAEEFLAERRIPLVHIERGGDITFHGRGQLIIYPILHLRRAGLSVAAYVNGLEEVMLRLAKASGVAAGRDPRNHGIWVGDKKLGSVGIAIRHGIAFHGLALNVDIDLTPFSWVNPCGLTGVVMTSLSWERGREVGLSEVKEILGDTLSRVFCRNFLIHSKEHVDAILQEPEPPR
jgi:lipoyl(octanoyl) transferase